MSLKIGAAFVVALTIVPLSVSRLGLGDNPAAAFGTFRPGPMKPHSTRTYTSSSELRVCNEGPVPVRLYISDTLNDSFTESLLEPWRCNQNMGRIMKVENFSDVSADVWAYGALGGRVGGGPGPKKK
jgi:hypothetical protein